MKPSQGTTEMAATTGTDPALTSRLQIARAEAGQALPREEVATIVREVIGSMEGDISAVDLRVYDELESLARYIQSARVEIAPSGRTRSARITSPRPPTSWTPSSARPRRRPVVSWTQRSRSRRSREEIGRAHV